MRKGFGRWRDLQIGTRLVLGFGLVLALTLWVAISMLQAQDTTQQRLQIMQQEQALGQQALQLAALQKGYALTRTADDAEQVGRTVADMQERLAVLQMQWTVEDTQRVTGALTHFATSFAELAKQLSQATEAQQAMLGHAQAMSGSFYAVFLDQLDALAVEAGPVALSETSLFQLEQVVGLNEKLQRIRDSELRWGLSSAPEHLSNWELGMNDAANAIDILAARMTGEQQLALAEALAALEDYRLAFERYQQSQERAANSAREAEQSSSNVGEVLRQLNLTRMQDNEASADSARSRSMFVLVLALIAGVVVAWLIRQSIVGPLRQCVALAARIAQGDLSLPGSARPARDEAGQLQAAMLQMIERLNGMITGVSANVDQLDHAAATLGTATARTANGLDEQQAESEQVASAVHQMTVTAHEVALNAGQASAAAEQANQLGAEGQFTLEQTSETSQRLVSEMLAGSQVMLELDRETQRIGTVLDVIRAVAEQTNLLALNAAIEAAHAGENGRGFAVVADEVRSLARRTADSIVEIEGLVAGLRSTSSTARKRMQSCQDLSADVLEMTGKSTAALARIASAVSDMDRLNHQIAAAASQQSDVSEQINRSVTRVRTIADTGQAQSAALVGSTTDVSTAGRSLREAVARFST